eukprot:jgi/Botrbrau1/3523/Bobra.341_2s0050.1
MRKSGVPQVTREMFIPDPTTFMPLWAVPEAVPSNEVVLEGKVRERLQRSAASVPGFASSPDTSKRRRWRASDYIHAYNSGAVTPSQVVENIIDLITQSDRADPPMRFLISLNADDLRNQAAASTERYKEGRPLSVLDGVPYTVIDGLDALPYQTTAGTSFLGSTRKVTNDAPCIQQLRGAGALLVGKANLHEIGVGMTGLNTIHGTARNPYDVACYTGGSSSGSAGMVSSGLVPFALGIDGGGSVRVPSSLCGLIGLRPTVGRTSREHCPDNAFSIMAFGVLAASVSDALLVHAAISNAGMEKVAFPPPALTVPQRLHNPRGTNGKLPLAGKRIGLYKAWFEDAAPEVVSACRAALHTLEGQGCEIEDICIPELEYVRVSQILTIGCELAEAYKHALSTPSLRHQFTLETRMSMGVSERFTATDYLQAQKIRTRVMTHFKRLFETCDYIVSPTVGCTAPKIKPDALLMGESDLTQTGELMRFTIPVNMAGIPAITLPVGYDSRGLPIGMQLMGRPWAEADLLYAGSVLEAALSEVQQMPKVFYDPLYGKVA